MSWWKFWESGYDRADNNLPPITKTVPMPKVKPPRAYSPGDITYINKDISEPVFAIVKSIMNDKKRWEFWAHGVKGGYGPAVDINCYNPYDRYTACQLIDKETGTKLDFQAILIGYSSMIPTISWGNKVYIDRDSDFYITNTWMTRPEKEYVISNLLAWWKWRIIKAEQFYKGKQERAEVRSKALQEKFATQERERLMKLFCKEEN